MKGKLSRMLRSGLSLMLVFCMLVSMAPAALATESNEINYVSIGDSMANGYGFVGYNQTSNDRNVYDFMTGKGMYGEGAYPNQFEDYLDGMGFDVKHTKLATSAMLAEDLLYLLGGRDYFNDGWNGYKDYVGTYSDEELGAHIQAAVKDADVITMGIGNAAFGAFLMDRVSKALGVFGSSLDADEKVNFEDAISVLNMDASQKALVMQAYNTMEAKLVSAVPADLADQYNLEDVVDIMAYTTASYIVNYKLLVEEILEMNPHVEIVLVGLLNTTYGMNVTDENGNVIIPFGDVMDGLFGVLNAYMAGLPAVLQAAGVAPEAKLYYASQPNPKFICQEFENLLDNKWDAADIRMDGKTIRQRNIDAFNSNLAEMIGMAITRAPLTPISLDDITNYDGSSWGVNGQNPDVQLSVAIYLAIEEAVARNTNTMDIPLEGLMTIAGDLSSVFTGLGTPPTDSPESTRTWLFNGLNTEVTGGMCKIYGLFKVGNGMSVHPTPAGHDQIAASVKAAYGNRTVEEETKENVEIALNELYKLMEQYGPEVAAQVWAQWEEYGYVDAVETSITELKEMLDARYTYYTETALPAINDSITVMTEQKDALAAELDALKMELAIKKGELEQVIANQEIGSIHTPDINIDVELGDNEQTIVPDHECVVDGDTIEAELEAAIADLEHAIAVIEALISDIEADIEDMIALAEQIAEAVAELEKTMSDIAEAGEDLANAIEEVAAVLQNNEGVVDAVIASYNAARTTALAAAEVLELTMGTANEMVADIDTMIAKIAEDAEALYNKFVTELPGCIEQIPEEAMIMAAPIALIQQELEANKEEIKAKLAEEIAALAAQYGINEESINAELAAINAKIKAEVDAQYAAVEAEIQAQIDALNAEANAKLAALQAELDALNAQLAAAADEDKAAIQAQIDRVTGDMTTVSEDLACAISHLEEAAQIAYDEIVAEVTAAYDAAITELNKQLADLKAAYDKAVEELTAAADKAIADLIAKAEEQIAELGKLGEELNKALNGIYDAIHNELADAQAAIEAILKGQLDAVEDLADALAELGLDTLNEIVNGLVEQVNALLEEATTADMIIDDDFMYVAIGDGSAAAEGYAEKLRDALNAEAAENGVNAIDFANYAKAGNTVAAERKNLSDVADADLITVGFSNVTFLDKAVESAMNGAELDWALVVGEENVPYVEQLLADVAAEIAAAGIEGEDADLINAVIEAYAYSAVQYAVELPGLIQDIREVNPDAVVIIVGNYNPVDGVSFVVDNVSIDIGEYVDYLVDGIAVHGVAYAILTGDAIYVDARDVETQNTKTELSITALMQMAYNKFSALYPNAAGDDSIAAEIADALNITYVKAEPTGMKGDVNLDGKVTAADIAVLRNYLLERTELSDQALYNAEVSYDGNVTAADIAVIRNYLLERIDTL